MGWKGGIKGGENACQAKQQAVRMGFRGNGRRKSRIINDRKTLFLN